MGIEITHPQYDEIVQLWIKCKDSYKGSHAIKLKTHGYLPPTSGQIEDGYYSSIDSSGSHAYAAYLTRAVYPDLFREAVDANVGAMHRKPPNIELPVPLKLLIDNCTLLGESLALFLRRVNSIQLKTGRVGVLGDINVVDGITTPVLTLYSDVTIRNWDDDNANGNSTDQTLVVLDETAYKLNSDYNWELVEKYRVLAMCSLNDGKLTPDVNGKIYATAELGKGDDINGAEFIAPSHMGKTLDKIPFSFINIKDISPLPDIPPMMGLVDLCLTIYMGEADYRNTLFLQGQETLVRIGADGHEDETVRTGTGSRIDLPINGDAKYIGVSSNGLPEQRTGLENDYKRASERAGDLHDTTSRSKESAESLKIRVASQTTTLPQVAMAAAMGVSNVIKVLCQWYNCSPETVLIDPNLDFATDIPDGDTLKTIVEAKVLGAPFSWESIHEWMFEQGFTQLTFEQEMALIALEPPDDLGMARSPDNTTVVNEEVSQ